MTDRKNLKAFRPLHPIRKDEMTQLDYHDVKKINDTFVKYVGMLEESQHDISRLQELNTNLLNGGELKDALEDLRDANELIELSEQTLEYYASLSEPIGYRARNSLSQVQAYRNKEQKP